MSAEAHDQELVRGVPRRAGQEDVLAAPHVVASVVEVAVEDGEHIVAIESLRERLLIGLWPKVAVRALDRVMEENDQGATVADLGQILDQPRASRRVWVHVEADEVHVGPIPRVDQGAVAAFDVSDDRRVADHIVIADGLEDRVLQEAVTSRAAIDPLKVAPLRLLAAVGHVTHEQHAARHLHLPAEFRRIVGTRQGVHLLDDAAIGVPHVARAKVRITSHEERDRRLVCGGGVGRDASA